MLDGVTGGPCALVATGLCRTGREGKQAGREGRQALVIEAGRQTDTIKAGRQGRQAS